MGLLYLFTLAVGRVPCLFAVSKVVPPLFRRAAARETPVPQKPSLFGSRKTRWHVHDLLFHAFLRVVNEGGHRHEAPEADVRAIGGGAGPVGSAKFFQIAAEALAQMDVQAIVSTSGKFPASSLPSPPPNVIFKDWVPGPAVIARASAVVFHGGYGTTMETVRYGVPGIVHPFHSEQEANGRRLEASGAARVLLPSREAYRVAHRRWRGGDFTTLIQLHSDLEPPMLRESITAVLEDKSYQENARRLSHALEGYGGASQAVDLIEKLL